MTTVNVSEGSLRIIRIDPDKGADEEGVITFFTAGENLGLIAVDREVVISFATKEHRCLAHSVRKEAAGGLDGLEVVERIEPVAWVQSISSGLEDLSQLEGIIALITANSHSGESIIKDEGVITTATGDVDQFDIRVVIHSLDESARNRKEKFIDLVGSNYSAIAKLVRTEEEEVIIVISEDPHAVNSGIRCSGVIDDIDGGSRESCESDLVNIAAVLAFQGEAGSNAGCERLYFILVIVYSDDIVTISTIDNGRAADCANINDVARSNFIAAENLGLASVCAGNEERIASISEAEGDGLDIGVSHTRIHAVAAEL